MFVSGAVVRWEQDEEVEVVLHSEEWWVEVDEDVEVDADVCWSEGQHSQVLPSLDSFLVEVVEEEDDVLPVQPAWPLRCAAVWQSEHACLYLRGSRLHVPALKLLQVLVDVEESRPLREEEEELPSRSEL